jgi:hypothetical protein
MSDMDRRIQEVRQRMAHQTGNQVIGNNSQHLQQRISAIRLQVKNNNNSNINHTDMAYTNSNNNFSPFVRRQSSSYSMQGDGQLDETASFGGGLSGNNVYKDYNNNGINNSFNPSSFPIRRSSNNMFSSNGLNMVSGNNDYGGGNYSNMFGKSGGNMFGNVNDVDDNGYDTLSSTKMQIMAQMREEEQEEQMQEELMNMMQQVMIAKQELDKQTYGASIAQNGTDSTGRINTHLHGNINDALIAKLDVVIEQNRHLQTQIDQGKAGKGGAELHQQKQPDKKLGGRPARRVKGKRAARKKGKKKKSTDEKAESSSTEDDEPEEEFKPDNSDPNTYQMDNEIESGGAKSLELEKTENWFKSQFATRQTRRRKGLVGGKLFADKKVNSLNSILGLGDEDEINFDEEKKKEVVEKQENKDEMRRELEKRLGITQVRQPRWRYFWKRQRDPTNPKNWIMQWTEDCLEGPLEGQFVCTMNECKENQIKHPRWVKKDLGDKEPLDDSIMRGRLLFKSLATVPQFCARLKIVGKNRRKDSVEKDREAFKEFLLLYYDKIRNWLGKVVKTPVTSLVTERNEKYNLDTKSDGTGFGGLFSRISGGRKNSRERRLMQLKVRVKGILDQLLSSTKTKKGDSGSSQNLPREIVNFLAKYFASDNIAWPEQYLWKTEHEKLEFNDLGLTRRMSYTEREAEDSDEEEDFNMKLDRTNTQRVQILLLNFLVGRILINHVIVRPEDCPSMGVAKSKIDPSTSHGQRIKKNLRLLASLLYQVLLRVENHEDLPDAENTGSYEEINHEKKADGERSKDKRQDDKKSRKKKTSTPETEDVIIEYTEDDDDDVKVDFQLNEKRQIKGVVDKKLAEKEIDNKSVLVKINRTDIKRKKGRDAMKELQKHKDKRPLTLVFAREVKNDKEGQEEIEKMDGIDKEGEIAPKVEEVPKFTSLWLKESDVSKSMFDDSHFYFGSPEHQDDFEEWLKDEATRLSIFGRKMVAEVMKAREKMKKEEKEKEETKDDEKKN